MEQVDPVVGSLRRVERPPAELVGRDHCPEVRRYAAGALVGIGLDSLAILERTLLDPASCPRAEVASSLVGFDVLEIPTLDETLKRLSSNHSRRFAYTYCFPGMKRSRKHARDVETPVEAEAHVAKAITRALAMIYRRHFGRD